MSLFSLTYINSEFHHDNFLLHCKDAVQWKVKS